MTRLVAGIVLLVACSRSTPPADDRVAAWRDDLRVLATTLADRHANAFFQLPEADWRRAVADLDQRIPTLDDAHVTAGLARLVASIGDAHTRIAVLGRGGTYPLRLLWFADGIFVAGAEASWAIGRRVTAVDGHAVDEVIARLAPLVSHDNPAGLHDELPYLIADPAMLAGADLIAAPDHATFTLADGAGATRALEVHPGHALVPVAPPAVLPLHLQGPETYYWNKYLAPERLLYFAYTACADDTRVGPLAAFAASTLAFADQHPVDRFVIDLRANGGGNSRVLAPLIDGLASRPALAGKVYVLIGMHTFSSAMLNAMELKRQVHAVLVGGPTGGKPSGYGEIQTFELPHSKLKVQYSTKLFSNPDFPGDAVEPDVPVTVMAADWFSGRDPAIDAILAR